MKDKIMHAAPAFLLASGSPRRVELLTRAGLRFEIRPPNVDETAPPGSSPRDEAAAAAALKCSTIARHEPDSVVIAADTVVELRGKSLGKPRDVSQARAMLEALSGAKHVVITAVCIEHRSAGVRREFQVFSEVTFGSMNESAIDQYISAVDVLDKAGAYGIQERADLLGASVSGSVDNVVGLPVSEVMDALRDFGIRGDR